MPYWDYYEPSRPREVKGGIKAQSKRGTFGESWWAKRWTAVLESFNLGARLSRGRSYARGGQVISIDIAQGKVQAKVQGSQRKPYDVRISVKPLTELEWEQAIEALAGQALFAAKLLAGQMPEDIEDAFQQAGLSLFPTRGGDLDTDCSCPDYSNPCKHSAAVYLLLGEEFDRDPFLIFTLRGMPREELMGKLAGAAAVPEETNEPTLALPPEPLAVDPETFWNGVPLEGDLFGEVRKPPVATALPRRLGSFPFWRGNTPFLDALVPIYTRASQHGLETFLAEHTTRN